MRLLSSELIKRLGLPQVFFFCNRMSSSKDFILASGTIGNHVPFCNHLSVYSSVLLEGSGASKGNWRVLKWVVMPGIARERAGKPWVFREGGWEAGSRSSMVCSPPRPFLHLNDTKHCSFLSESVNIAISSYTTIALRTNQPKDQPTDTTTDGQGFI